MFTCKVDSNLPSQSFPPTPPTRVTSDSPRQPCISLAILFNCTQHEQRNFRVRPQTTSMKILFSRSNAAVMRVCSRPKGLAFINDTQSSGARQSTMAATKDRSYQRALQLLETIASNSTVTSMVGMSAKEMNAKAIPEMLEWLGKAGYSQQDLKQLRAIHIAGTKGKGSVSAMVGAILMEYKDGVPSTGAGVVSQEQVAVASEQSESSDGEPYDSDISDIRMPRKEITPDPAPKGLGDIGMYTSPHLISVRERICVNGKPISQANFAESFFRLWDRFTEAAIVEGHSDPQSPETRPNYFRYLTIMAFDIFLQRGIRTAVIECGIGGAYDSTNVLPAEGVSVAAVTRLGIDHVAMLGDDIRSIAWHKSGIFKRGGSAFTVGQLPEARRVLKARAKDAGCSLKLVVKKACGGHRVRTNLEGQFQRINARLAISVAGQHLHNMGYGDLVKVQTWPKAFDDALSKVSWPGRCEVRKEKNIGWFIDGAHTTDSISVVAQWFAKRSDKDKPFMLIFNQQIRDGVPLLEHLCDTLKTELKGKAMFKHAVFCANTVYSPTGRPTTLEEAIKLPSQKAMDRAFSEVQPESENIVAASIEEAVEHARAVAARGEEIQVLVTGSLHLVGGVLQILNGHKKDDMSYK